MKAVSINQIEKVVHDSEKNLVPEEQTIFVLKPLSLSEQALLKDKNRFADGELVLSAGQIEILSLHLGLENVENLIELDNNRQEVEVKFERDETKKYIKGISRKIRPWKDECLEKIPADVRLWLSLKIRGLDEESLKESREETEKN